MHYPAAACPRHLPDDEVISQIVSLAESQDEDALSRYCVAATMFVESCKIAKKKKTLETLLDQILKIRINHSRLSSILRMTFSSRNAIANWYATRDRVAEILGEREPERSRRLMIGLMEDDPQTPEAMDGLNAWQSLIKAAEKYR
jgi:hypothetical protein